TYRSSLKTRVTVQDHWYTPALTKLSDPEKASVSNAFTLLTGRSWSNREKFVTDLKSALAQSGLVKPPVALIKTIWTTVGQHDPKADLVTSKGEPEVDAMLRDTENVPLTEDVETYFTREVLPHVPDAWIDHDKTKTGYEIPFTRHFYQYVPPRPLAEIQKDLRVLVAEIQEMLYEVGA
ncbi:SAM-dependent DNA methyltransferase, partial [Antrihabitans sp. NCIMB 15450]